MKLINQSKYNPHNESRKREKSRIFFALNIKYRQTSFVIERE
jgi:hypothetical protein